MLRRDSMMASAYWVDTTYVSPDAYLTTVGAETGNLKTDGSIPVPEPLMDDKPGQCPGQHIFLAEPKTAPCHTDSDCMGDEKCCYNARNYTSYCRMPVFGMLRIHNLFQSHKLTHIFR